MRGIDKGRPGRPGDAVIVTGSGTGIGLETSLALAAAGFRVFATVRNLDQRTELQAAASARGVTLEVLRLDVTDRASIAEALATVVDGAGGVYALVNNAGVGLRGCTEDCAEEEIRAAVRDERARHDRGHPGGDPAHARGWLRAHRDGHLGRRPRLRIRRDDVLRDQVRAGGSRRGTGAGAARRSVSSR